MYQMREERFAAGVVACTGVNVEVGAASGVRAGSSAALGVELGVGKAAVELFGVAESVGADSPGLHPARMPPIAARMRSRTSGLCAFMDWPLRRLTINLAYQFRSLAGT